MHIRLATQTDLPVINEIYNQAVRKRFCTADLEEIQMSERESWFAAHTPERYPVFVAEDENEIIGWMCYSPYRQGRRALQTAVEVSYYLHNKHQGKGIGSQLMDFAITQAPKYNIKHLFAILLEPNTASIKLLEKYGFEQWACLPNIANIDGQWCSHVYYGREV
ncbi:GNAT family N-acetyltransferase [Marinifilum caeruleilacunae]|uniref:N-acetyltransferase family protein n=1 Tax=Marinifilum caeruleilacunae TaxID=2499076 RepID=A0ABX1WSB0_9BACT|nr:GNAT family N-acetyltransferase [Marinifilum caeruleilacunae]NOU58990.1 N-acetyltransferase family protein [Marinifilum caeruleilacunae]